MKDFIYKICNPPIEVRISYYTYCIITFTIGFFAGICDFYPPCSPVSWHSPLFYLMYFTSVGYWLGFGVVWLISHFIAPFFTWFVTNVGN